MPSVPIQRHLTIKRASRPISSAPYRAIQRAEAVRQLGAVACLQHEDEIALSRRSGRHAGRSYWSLFADRQPHSAAAPDFEREGVGRSKRSNAPEPGASLPARAQRPPPPPSPFRIRPDCRRISQRGGNTASRACEARCAAWKHMSVLGPQAGLDAAAAKPHTAPMGEMTTSLSRRSSAMAAAAQFRPRPLAAAVGATARLAGDGQADFLFRIRRAACSTGLDDVTRKFPPAGARISAAVTSCSARAQACGCPRAASAGFVQGELSPLMLQAGTACRSGGVCLTKRLWPFAPRARSRAGQSHPAWVNDLPPRHAGADPL